MEFLHSSKQCWRAREQTRLGATSKDPVCIEELEEDEAKEYHFVEAQTMQKDAREENVVAQEEQFFTKVQLIV